MGPYGFAGYTTVVLGLGFVGDKDLSAFISEVIPGNTSRGWESETEKGKKSIKRTLPIHYHGQPELSHEKTRQESRA